VIQNPGDGEVSQGKATLLFNMYGEVKGGGRVDRIGVVGGNTDDKSKATAKDRKNWEHKCVHLWKFGTTA